MKNTEKLSFDQLDQKIEVLTLKDSGATLGGMTLDDLNNIVTAMEANGISSLTNGDLAAQELSFETLASSQSQIGVNIGNSIVLINVGYTGPTLTTTIPPPVTAPAFEDPRANEIQFALNNPISAVKIYANSKTALLASQNLFANDPISLHNGLGDAFRHAYWSALNAKIGSVLAADYGLIHEDFPGNPIEERNMDIANNNYGIAFSKANPNMTPAQLSAALYLAAITGKLTTLSVPE